MRLIIYDAQPGPGIWQGFLKTCWIAGAKIQKSTGAADAYFGANTWEEAFAWLRSQPTVTSLQFFGHGAPASVYVGEADLDWSALTDVLKPKCTPATVVWFRGCSTFQGAKGHTFSQFMADNLRCTVAGHTRITGPWSGGLHTRKPNTAASWPQAEGEVAPSWIPKDLKWSWPGPNMVLCTATKVPEGW